MVFHRQTASFSQGILDLGPHALTFKPPPPRRRAPWPSKTSRNTPRWSAAYGSDTCRWWHSWPRSGRASVEMGRWSEEIVKYLRFQLSTSKHQHLLMFLLMLVDGKKLFWNSFCWEFVVWCCLMFFCGAYLFLGVHWDYGSWFFFLMGKAVRKMTLSDPWMEGDDFQPGSQLNSFVSFGLVGISHFGSLEVLGRHLFGLPNFHGNVRASKVACLYFYALSDNLTLNPRCMFDKCYHWCVRNPVPLSIHTLVI